MNQITNFFFEDEGPTLRSLKLIKHALKHILTEKKP